MYDTVRKPFLACYLSMNEYNPENLLCFPWGGLHGQHHCPAALSGQRLLRPARKVTHQVWGSLSWQHRCGGLAIGKEKSDLLHLQKGGRVQQHAAWSTRDIPQHPYWSTPAIRASQQENDEGRRTSALHRCMYNSQHPLRLLHQSQRQLNKPCWCQKVSPIPTKRLMPWDTPSGTILPF